MATKRHWPFIQTEGYKAKFGELCVESAPGYVLQLINSKFVLVWMHVISVLDSWVCFAIHKRVGKLELINLSDFHGFSHRHPCTFPSAEK